MGQKNSSRKLPFLLLIIPIFFLIFNSAFLHEKINLTAFVSFILCNIFISIYLLRSFSSRISLIHSEIERSNEQMNINNVEVKKAQELNVKVISEEEFLELIK